MADRSPKSSDKARRKKTLIYTAVGAGVVVIGGAAYLWFTRTPHAPETSAEPEQAAILPAYTPEPSPPVRNLPEAPSGFPLKKGSKGPLVTALQKMLNTRFKSGLATDGDWGRKTDTALVKAGLPTQIDAATYAALVGQAQQQANPTASEIVANWTGTPLELATKAANGIAYMVNANDALGAMTFIRAMRSVSDYSAVNAVFKTLQTANRSGAKARRTLVNALLGDDMGWNGTATGQFTQELLRMGLKHNTTTDKWTLSGLGGSHPTVRVTVPTTIWNSAGQQTQVPAGCRIGMAVASSNGITQVFTPWGETVFAPSHALSQVIL
jgi:hypothetical protein